MTVSFKRISAGAMLMAPLMGNAYAANNACPAPGGIKQTAGEYGGYTYTAPVGNGQQWSGENPMAKDSDLARLVFKEAYIHNQKSFVTCDYVVRDGRGGVRMVLKTTGPVKATGNSWRDARQSDGTVLQSCAGGNPALCAFE
ncbi:DUF3757 domain-containing protein [Paraburkholderia fungorum]|uniref:DUF3757 domain-containing protein n=1 Tax=Paraburkholderia fungorum TaxID=134537 RepID=UPI0038BCFF3C